MSLFKGLLGAAVGGIMGAAAWTAVSSMSGYELGIVAWGVGGLAGYGMAAGTRMRGGLGSGLLAALVAVLAVLSGKYAVAHFSAQRYIEERSASITMEDARDHLAADLYTEYQSNGRHMTETDDGAYPPEVIAGRDRVWDRMSVDEREKYLASCKASTLEEGREAHGAFTVFAFLTSFGLYDLLWFGLAVSTAYRLGSRRAEGAIVFEVPEESNTNGMPAAMKVAAMEEAQANAAHKAALGSPLPSTAPTPPAVVRPAPAPSAPAADTPEAPTGLGIFARLGQPPTKTAYTPPGNQAPAPERRKGEAA